MATPTKTTLTDAQRLQQARLPGGGVDLLALLGAQPEAPRMDRTWGEALQDTGLQLLEGGANIAGAVPSLVAPSSGVARWFKEQADDLGDAQSPVMQRKLRRADAQIALADQDSIIDQGVAAAKAYGADPALMSRLVATNLASIIPGVGAAKAAQGVRMAQVLGAGGTAIEAAAAGAKAGQMAAGVTNAVLNGGGARQDAYEDLYKTLVAKGYSPQQAQQMAEDQSWLAAGVGAATGFASGHMGLDKAVVNKGLSAGGAKAGAKAFAGELGGELLEEVSPKAATNLQAGEYDARPWSRDVGRTAVETVLGAGPFAVHAGVKEGFNKELDEGKPGEKPSDAPLLLGHKPDPLLQFPDGTVGRQSEVDAYLASLPDEDQRVAARAKLYGYAPQQAEVTTSPGAAPAGAGDAATTTAPQALDATTSPGAARQYGNGIDFTRDIDTAGLAIDTGEPRPAAAAFDPAAVQAKTFPAFALERGHKPSELRNGSPEWAKLQSEWAQVKLSRAGTDPEGNGAVGQAAPEIQNRDRSRPASVVQMQAMAQNPDYMRLGVSRSPETGAPMVFAVGDNQAAAVAMGHADTAVMSDGQRVPFRYAVMEAGDVQPSNFADGSVNPLFDGAQHGTVKALNNGRTAGVRAAYERGTAGKYRQELAQDAQAHGIDPAVIDGMKAPMLVRLYSEADNRQNMGAKSQSQALGLSATEQAGMDAQLLDAATMGAFDGGALDSAANAGFARAFIGKLQKQGYDVAGMMDAGGKLSQDGVRRLQAALVQRAFGDGDLVEQMFNSTDTDIRAIGEAFKSVAGEWAAMRDAAASGAVNPQVDITGNLLQAIRMVQKARRERSALFDAVTQVDMLTGAVPDELTVGALRLLYSGHYLTRAVGRDALQDALRKYVAAAMVTSTEVDMLGEQVGPGQILSTMVQERDGVRNDAIEQGPNPTGASAQDGTGQPGGGDAAGPAADAARPAQSGRGSNSPGQEAAQDGGRAGGQAQAATGEPRHQARAQDSAENGRGVEGQETGAFDPVSTQLHHAAAGTTMNTVSNEVKGDTTRLDGDAKQSVPADNQQGNASAPFASHEAKTALLQSSPALTGAQGALNARGQELLRTRWDDMSAQDQATIQKLANDRQAASDKYNEMARAKERDAHVRRLSGEREIRQTNGKPFKTEKAAAKFITDNGIEESHAPAQVDGGWVARGFTPAELLERENAARGIEPYVAVQERVINELGLREGHKAETLTDAQWEAIEARTKEVMRQQRAQAQTREDEAGKGPMFSRKASNKIDYASRIDDAEVRSLVTQYANVEGAPTEAQIREAVRQFRETERAYGGREAYDKAKAAGKTKLTYGQWVQVRTPNFKNWFGDWEALANRKFLDGSPISSLTGDEFKADGVPLTEKVPQWYIDRGVSTVAVEGIGDVALDAAAVKRSLGHGIGRDKAAAFAAVPDVLRNGQIVHREPMRGSTDGGMVYHVAAPISIDGREFVADVLVKADGNAQRMYVHEVALKEKLQQSDFKVGAVAAEAGKRADADAGAVRSVLQSIYSVNPADVSKVVDPETGEPLVVYHGTAADFNQFSKSKATDRDGRRLGMGWGKGKFYFAETGQAASSAASFAQATGRGKAQNVMPVYLVLQRPIESTDYMARVDAQMAAGKSRDAAIAAVDREVRGIGHDGIVDAESGGIAVVDPSQIKSATGNIGTFDGDKNDIRFSFAGQQAATAEAQALNNPATVESVRAAVRELVGGMGRLPNNLGRVVVATSQELRHSPRWAGLTDNGQALSENGQGQPLGWFDPGTNTVVLVADAIEAGQELGVVAHELMHKHGREVLGDEGWRQLHSTIEGWAKAKAGSQERRIYEEAARRVQSSRGEADAAAHSTEELFPYAVQVAMELGIKPNMLAQPGTVSRWLGQVRAALRQVWLKVLGQAQGAGSFEAQDLVNLAFGIAQRENPKHRGQLDGALLGDEESNALRELSDSDEIFAQPRSHATNLQEVVKDIAPKTEAGAVMENGDTTSYSFTTKDGEPFTINVRENQAGALNPMMHYGQADGMPYPNRPGESAQAASDGRGDVWVDVSQLKGQGNGAAVYAAAADFAHNTGRVFVGDPTDLSAAGMRRRPVQMLSAALRWGSTDHVAPHPKQVAGDAKSGVPALDWVAGDTMGNLRKLIDLNLALEESAGDANQYTYDSSTGNFRDSEGKAIDRAGIELVAENARRTGAPGFKGSGGRTNARNALLRALLQGTGGRGGGQDGRSAGLLEKLSGYLRRDEHAARAGSEGEGAGKRQLTRLFSRAAAADPYAGYTQAQRDSAEKVFGQQAKPSLKERWDAARANVGTKLRQGLVDQFAPIKEFSNKAYILARMTKGTDGAVEAAMLFGKPFLRDGVLDVDIKDGGFAKVLAGLDGEQDRFLQWVAANRSERLKADGKENLLTDADITNLKSLSAGAMADGRARAPLYQQALHHLNDFNEANLKVALESGLIDQAAYDIMKDQPYVPFYRLMEEGDLKGPKVSAGLLNQQAFKKLKGGTQQINGDLLHNVLLNWNSLYAASARNRAALETLKAADGMGIAYQVSADTKGAVAVRRNGVQEHWMVEDPYLLDAMSAISYQGNALAKPLAPFKRLLTMAVTVNPAFKIRNLIRDSLSAMAQSELGYNPFANVAQGWKAMGKDSQTYASMLAGGGLMRFGSLEDSSRARRQIESLGAQVLDAQGFAKLTGQMHKLWSAYEELGDKSENANRAALYQKLRDKGVGHAEANFMARDLMDFSMSGKWEAVRFLAQTVPFLNARLQGLYKLGRAAKDDPKKFAAVTGAVAAASLALLAAYGDDDDWKKREDWDRDTYWWFKVGGQAFRIPKPFEVGAIGTLAERTAELMFSQEMTGKRFGQSISSMVFQTFAMDPTPQAFKPFVDVYSNKDSFTKRAIEGMADERLRPQDRFNERTSEVARLLGAAGLPNPVNLAKGEYKELSPKQVDALLKGYFGWLATVATTASDMALRPLLGRGERPAMQLRDVFLAGNFVESLPTGSSRYVTAMYEQAKEVEQAWASHQAALKAGDVQEAQAIRASDGDKLKKHGLVLAGKQSMAQLSAMARRIEADKTLSAQDKREKLDAINAKKDRIARRVMAMH